MVVPLPFFQSLLNPLYSTQSSRAALAEINLKCPLYTGRYFNLKAENSLQPMQAKYQTSALLCISSFILCTHQNPTGFRGSSGHVSEAELAHLSVGVFAIS